MLIILIVLFILGCLFGSLSTVLVDRWHEKKGGILLGRSECPKCRHTLGPTELVPIFSYLFQRGKCKSCAKPIPVFYPLAEILMGSIFVYLTYSYLRLGGELFSPSHIMILLLGFITAVYMLYDLRYMEIPDQIMVPGIYLYATLLIFVFFFPSLQAYLFDRVDPAMPINDFVADHFIAAALLYTFLYLQILIPGAWYLAKRKRFSDLLGLFGSYFLFPFLLLFSFFEKNLKKDEEEVIPTWIGGGDLRIALFIGITLGISSGVVSFIIAYILGSVFSAIYLLLHLRSKTTIHQIPFGPFLGCGWLVSIFYAQNILEILSNLFYFSS